MQRSRLPTFFVLSSFSIACTDRAADDDAADATSAAATTTGEGSTTGSSSSSGSMATSSADTSGDVVTSTDEGSDTGAVVLGPCDAQTGDDVMGPPRITAISFIGDATLVLTFSEPIAPIDAVDPSKFRLSAGIAYGTAMTSYWDPVALLCSNSDYCTGDYIDVIDVGCLPDDPSAPAVALDTWGMYLCGTLDFLAMYNDAYLLLHYAPGDGPGVVDLAGESLAAIGPDWVHETEILAYVDGRFPGMDPVVPIPCPGS